MYLAFHKVAFPVIPPSLPAVDCLLPLSNLSWNIQLIDPPIVPILLASVSCQRFCTIYGYVLFQILLTYKSLLLLILYVMYFYLKYLLSLYSWHGMP